jgi:hypothetical protein
MFESWSSQKVPRCGFPFFSGSSFFWNFGRRVARKETERAQKEKSRQNPKKSLHYIAVVFFSFCVAPFLLNFSGLAVFFSRLILSKIHVRPMLSLWVLFFFSGFAKL